MCIHCAYTEPSERPPCVTGLAPLAYVHALQDLGVDRGRALLMTPGEAVAALGAAVRNRRIDGLLAQAPDLERARAA